MNPQFLISFVQYFFYCASTFNCWISVIRVFFGLFVFYFFNLLKQLNYCTISGQMNYVKYLDVCMYVL